MKAILTCVIQVAIPILITVSARGVSASTSVRTMHLATGESVAVEFPAGSDIKVSRKGVVDVFATSETSWQITALRGGLVIIDALDGSTGTPHLPRIFVDVKGSNAPDRPIVAVGIPDWICKKKGIKCDGDAGIISGTIGDFRWLIRSTSWCHSSRSCFLFIQTNESARKDLEHYIRDSLGQNYEVTTKSSGHSNVTTLCDPITQDQHIRQIDAVLPRFIEDKIINFSCTEGQGSYKIRIKARKVSSSHGDISGFDGVLKSTTSLESPDQLTGKIKVTSAISDEKTVNEAETIGEPFFIASENIDFHALIGGELPYLSEGERRTDTYQWKEYGLSVKGKIKSMRQKRIRSSIELFLKSVNDQPAQGLSTSSLKTNIETEVNEWSLVGELDLSSQMTSERTTPSLAAIPIIGPLFRLAKESKAKSRLQVWMRVEKI